MRTKTHLLAAFLLAISPVLLIAGEKDSRFSELDTNKDGQISQDELNAYGSTAAGQSDVKEVMQKDENGDGTISREEYDQAGEKRDSDEAEAGGAW